MTSADEPVPLAGLDEIPTPAEVFIAPHDPAPADALLADPATPAPATPAPATPAPARSDDERDGTTAAGGEPADVVVADRVASAVLGVDGVAGLHSGTFGEVASYLPGRRVEGIRITDEVTEVHLVLQWGAPVLATADAVRAVVATIVGTPVDITVQDVVDPHAGTRDQPSPTKETA